MTNRPYEIKKEVGMDYTRLRDLLAAGEWEKANWETGQVILRAANREEEGNMVAIIRLKKRGLRDVGLCYSRFF